MSDRRRVKRPSAIYYISSAFSFSNQIEIIIADCHRFGIDSTPNNPLTLPWRRRRRKRRWKKRRRRKKRSKRRRRRKKRRKRRRMKIKEMFSEGKSQLPQNVFI